MTPAGAIGCVLFLPDQSFLNIGGKYGKILGYLYRITKIFAEWHNIFVSRHIPR